MAEYKGTVELIAGITQANGQTFALVNAPDVQVGDERLPDALENTEKRAFSGYTIYDPNGQAIPSITGGQLIHELGTPYICEYIRTQPTYITPPAHLPTTTNSEFKVYTVKDFINTKMSIENPEYTGTLSGGSNASVAIDARNSVAIGQNVVAKGPNQIVLGQYNDVQDVPEWVRGSAYSVGAIVKTRDASSMPYNYYKCNTANSDTTQPGMSDKWDFTTSLEAYNYIEIIGNGITDNNRSNARVLDRNGNEYLKGKLYINGTNADATGGKEVAIKDNPEFTGSISMGRTENSVVGENSVALGKSVRAVGDSSVALGRNTYAVGSCQFVFGSGNVGDTTPEWVSSAQYNKGDRVHSGDFCWKALESNTNVMPGTNSLIWMITSDNNYVEIVGGGSITRRVNLRTLDWSGNEHLNGTIYVKSGGYGATGGKEVATKEYVDNSFTAQDAMLYKGVVNSHTDLPSTHEVGWTYKVEEAGMYAGVVCEVGDTIICVEQGTSADDSHWNVIQNNLDIATNADIQKIINGGSGDDEIEEPDVEGRSTVVVPVSGAKTLYDNLNAKKVDGPSESSTNSNKIALFNGNTGKLLKASSYTAGAAAARGVDTNFNNTSSANLPTTAAVATQLALKVAGPESSTTNHVALFSDSTGKVIKDGGLVVSSVSIDTDGNVTIGKTDGISITNENIKTLLDGKITKPSSATTGHVALFNNGNAGIKDGGTIQSLVINDSATSTDKTWSSNKIDTVKAPKANPVFTGSISLGRKAGSFVSTNSVAVGSDTEATGSASHAEGLYTVASGDRAHVEGTYSMASGGSSHAEGYYTYAKSVGDHSEGRYSTAAGTGSHSQGEGTATFGTDSTVLGKYNVLSDSSRIPSWTPNTKYTYNIDYIQNDNKFYVCVNSHTSGNTFSEDGWAEISIVSNSFAEIVGNGTSRTVRSNARALDWDGNEYLAGDIYVNCGSDSTGGSKLMSASNIASIFDTQAIIDEYGG